MKVKRRKYRAEFKSRVAIEALRERKSLVSIRLATCFIDLTIGLPFTVKKSCLTN